MSAAADMDADPLAVELRTKRICRMCLSTEEPLSDLYSHENRLKGRVPLPLQIMSSVSLEIFTNDGLPRTVCDACRLIIDYCYRFKHLCRRSDHQLRQFTLTGVWPERSALPAYPADLIAQAGGVRPTAAAAKAAATNAQLAGYKRKPPVADAIVVTVPPAKRLRQHEPAGEPVLLNAGGAATGASSSRQQASTLKATISPNGSISTISSGATTVVMHNKNAPTAAGRRGGAAAAAATAGDKPRILNRTSGGGVGAKSSPQLHATDAGTIELKFDTLSDGNDDQHVIAMHVDDEDGNRLVEMQQSNAAAAAAEPTEEIATDVFPCTQCNRTFPLQQLLDMHMERHTRERQAQCDVCQRRFFNKYDLNKHMLVHRSGEKRFQCTVCPAGFSRVALLKQHEQQHLDVLPHQCATCDKRFPTQDECEVHERKHNMVRKFQCPNCPKSFAFKQGLDRHEVVHSKQQPFPCSYCGVSFNTATRLARHLTEHAGSRPYPCRVCTKSFLLSHHLNRHMRSHKGRAGRMVKLVIRKSSEAYAEEAGDGGGDGQDRSGADGEDADQQGLLECMVCDQAFGEYSELMEHSEQHALESGECPFCKLALPVEAAAVEHMRQHAEQQFACEFCDLMFADEASKVQHCQEEHVDEQELYDMDDRAREASQKNNGGAAQRSTGGGANEPLGYEVIGEAHDDGGGEQPEQEGESIVHEFIVPEAGEEEEEGGGDEFEVAIDEAPEEPDDDEPEPEAEPPRRQTRGSAAAPSVAKPKILNYIKKEPEPKKDKRADDATDTHIEDIEFEYVDIVKETKPLPTKATPPSTAGRQQLQAALQRQQQQQSKPQPTTTSRFAAAKTSSRPTPTKTSPVKQIPAAQQKLEEQLKNAMRRSGGSGAAASTATAGVKEEAKKTAQPAAKTSPGLLTKVNMKTLPSGVTLKKVQLNRSPTGGAAAAAPSVSPAARKPAPATDAPKASGTPASTGAKPVLRRVEVPPRKQPGTAAAVQPKPAAAAAGAKKPAQSVRMTQAQVEAMAREGKIHMKDGQVFLRQS